MLRDDVLDSEDNEMDVTDDELEKFIPFCYMNKPIENHPNITVMVTYQGVVWKKLRY